MAQKSCPYDHNTPRNINPAELCPVTNQSNSSIKRDEATPTTNSNLSNERQISNIPSTSGEWYYPSPQQFYKSVQRKGHHSVESSSIPMAVKIHNEVNEESWRRIMEFENLHSKSCPNPKLLRFISRSDVPSLKSKLKNLVGFESPFDRHDWYVDRCGQNIKYLIDFYDGQTNPSTPVSIYLDVRPELSFGGIKDQLHLNSKNILNYFMSQISKINKLK